MYILKYKREVRFREISSFLCEKLLKKNTDRNVMRIHGITYMRHHVSPESQYWLSADRKMMIRISTHWYGNTHKDIKKCGKMGCGEFKWTLGNISTKPAKKDNKKWRGGIISTGELFEEGK